MEDVNASLNSKELKKKVSKNWVKNQSSAFVARGKRKERDKNRNKGKSKNRKGTTIIVANQGIGNFITQSSKKIKKLVKNSLL